jgi:hypothetical protein
VPERALPVAADRERPARVQREREQEHDPDPELREAEPDERHGPDHVVGHPVRSRRRDGRERHRDQDREQRPQGDQPQRDRHAVDDELPRGDAVEERRAEIAVEEPDEEALVLHRQRVVEPPLLVEDGDARRRRAVSEHRPRRVAGDEVDQEEHEDRHAERDRDHLQQAPHDVLREAHG